MAEPDDTTVSTPVDDGTGDQPAVIEPQDTPITPIEPVEPIAPELTPEQVAEDRLLGKLQSWQGRREKDMKEEIFSGIANLLNQQQMQTPPPDFSGMNEDIEPDPDVDVKAWIRWDQRMQQQNMTNVQQTNERAYFSTLNNPQVRHQDEDIHNAAMKEIQHNQNLDPSGQPMNPAADAMLNYNNAIRSVIEKRFAPNPTDGPTVNPLQGNAVPQQGLGVTQPSPAAAASVASMPKNLSDASRKLISRSGWNADKVRKSLAKES